MRAKRSRTLVTLSILVVIAGGCTSGATDLSGSEALEPAAAPTSPTTDEHSDEGADDHASEAFAFGEPADPADADRTVQIRATDAMAFEPATLDVRAAEVVTFEVDNVGQIPHDFTLGDEHAQQEHAREMAAMGDAGMAHADPNTLPLTPGETGSITWRFHDAGAVLYGCHQPGHYDAGMVGSVDVSP